LRVREKFSIFGPVLLTSCWELGVKSLEITLLLLF
jgi:hypothetical protein